MRAENHFKSYTRGSSGRGRREVGGKIAHIEGLEPIERCAERLLGETVVHCRQIMGGGFTAAERWVAEGKSGASAFIKRATTADTEAWLRDELRVYEAVSSPHMPRFLGWNDEDVYPALAIEDLSRGLWSPPWTPQRVEGVLEAIDAIRHLSVPELPSLRASLDSLPTWDDLDPQAFLGLELCSEAWLESALPVLLDAEASIPLEGSDLLHLDVRGDNICLLGGRTVLVDWNWACRGNGDFDVAAWLPTLALEGGPQPQELMPHAGSFAARLSGYWAAVVPRAAPEGARTGLRELQVRALSVALTWAATSLSLPPPR